MGEEKSLKKFTFTVHERTYSSASFDVWATDEATAEELADEIENQGDLEFNIYEGERFDRDCDEYEENDKDIIYKAEKISTDKNGRNVRVGDSIKYMFTQYFDDKNNRLKIPVEEECVEKVEEIAWDLSNDEVCFMTKDCILLYDSDVELVTVHTEDGSLSDRDYWMKHGHCPTCKIDGTIHSIAMQFVCKQCNWKL